MAAIKPRLELQDEPKTAVEEAGYVCASAPAHAIGLGHVSDLGAATACPSPAEAIASAHQGLLTMAWLRAGVAEQLTGKRVTVVQDGREIKLVLDEPIGPGALWNPAASPTARQFSLLSWTSKMACPSFSLPAGAMSVGGSCPGADAGQSIVPAEALARAQAVARASVGSVRLADAICSRCYAEGGQYSTGQVQFAQLMRYAWTRQAVLDGSFAPVMIVAIQGADFDLRGERTHQRFFRIHDSGDFYSPEYLRAWKAIADALPDVTFWAPSRIWVTKWGVAAVNTVNSPPKNLVIRPSAYHFGDPAPESLGPGWASGSTAIHKSQNMGMTPEREHMVEKLEHKKSMRLPGGPDPRFTWDCRAYAADSMGHTCRNAVSPEGVKGCRACWLFPAERINYTEH